MLFMFLRLQGGRLVLGQDGWSVTYTKNSICALKGSTVDLSCSYTYPRGHTVTTTTWNKWKSLTWTQIPDKYEDRIEYRGNKENDYLRLNDSAGYRFRFITSGGKFAGSPVSLTVTVSPSGERVEGSSVTLTCSSDANPPVDKYTWYKKNGGGYQSMTGPQHVFNQIQSSDSGEYYCESQNEMGTDRSRTINMDVKYGPKNTSVSVSPSGEIVEGSSVTLTCSSDANPDVDKYTWYKKNRASLTGSEKTYNFTTIRSEDSGEYYCGTENKYGRLNSSSVSVDVQC
uniref:Ig-like domain-containing protein n=1 Tax=Hucho hucho TaxID=62062 RepID=A0A4W5KDN2_9TELE